MPDVPSPDDSLVCKASPPTVVALGASAGGLEALKTFFGAVDPQGALAYIVITHLPASHESHLDELLGRVTPLPVTQAHDGDLVQEGHVYVSAPEKLLGISSGRLTLETAGAQDQVPTPMPTLMPIDRFMSELADDRGSDSIGIVLSGTAHDGTAGLKAIRAAGGLTLVQAPETAEFPGMPRSAIASGAVDQVLGVQAMPAALADYLHHVPLDLPQEGTGSGTEGPEDARPKEHDPEGDDEALRPVLRLIQTRTGHDFRGYRPAMLGRRLRRRMGLCRLSRVRDYLELLNNSSEEVDRLKDEFLISVTDFFRDPSVWAALAQTVIPELVAQRLQDDLPIRVWAAGCATGEEAYSIAMLLLEQTDGKMDPQRIQIFATDIDLRALSVARAGAYLSSIVGTVSAGRLARFFDRRGDRYVARKSLRDAIVFAPHNVVRDTPFSRIDLLLCRNLLIYFKPVLQQRVLELFHFAIQPDGMLLLGKAESIGTHTDLFVPVARIHGLYRRIGARGHLPLGLSSFGRTQAGAFDDRAPSHRSVTELVHAQLGDRTVTAAVLVDRESRALYFHGDTVPFLQLQGKASLELLSLVHPALRVRVRSFLRSALTDGLPTACEIGLHIGEASHQILLQVEPVKAMDAHGLALVMFTLQASQTPTVAEPASAAVPSSDDLARQYEEARRELAEALEDAQRSNEDLRTVNEESLALNEELQSSNEELESSKEELESLNEEVTSVNAQLDEKIRELALKNDDLNNLLMNAGLATILIDASGRIRRFTPAASEVFSLKAGDEGRLLSDISSRVNDPEFLADLSQVASTEAASEAEVRSASGQIFLRRILPYRTEGGCVQGAVITFTDITALRNVAQRARELFAVLQDSNDAVVIYDRDGTILAWNAGAQRIYGHTSEAILGTRVYDLLPQAARASAIDLAQRVMATGQGASMDSQRLRLDGAPITVSITLSALRDADGAIYALLSTERDISAKLRSESEIYFRRLADRIPVLLRVEDTRGSAEFVNQPCTLFTGRPREALLGDGWLQFIHPQDRERYLAEHAQALAVRGPLETDLRVRRADGVYRWMRSVSVPHFDTQEVFVGYIALMFDVEDRRVAESALVDSDRRKDDFLAMLAHELRNPLAPIRTAVAVISRSAAHDDATSWAVSIIGRQTELLAKLLDDLLDVARIARGKVNLDKAPVELAVLVQRAVEICQPLIDLRHHRLSVDIPATPLLVEGDLMRLTQVLANLLTNAAKYMDEGGQIRLKVCAEGRSVVIRVLDTGMGMQPELLALVFEPFMQADASLDRSRGGLGLGLTLVKQLVSLHGGVVEAHSGGLGLGSEFVVRLPLLERLPPAARAGAPETSAERGRSSPPASVESTAGTGETPRPTGSCRVLIVDDNRDAAESLALLMRLSGHQVALAFNGQDALEIAQHCRPQVVVLDIGLPGMDGYQVARCLRGAQGTAHSRLIALTGYGQPDDVARAHAAGFDHHFVKPVDPQTLLDLSVCEPE